MKLTIDPKNDKIKRYLFKHNCNVCRNENIYCVFQQYFKACKSVIISTPYMKNTNLFKSENNLITLSGLSKFLSHGKSKFSVEELKKKKIDIIFFDKGFFELCKDYCENKFINKSAELNSDILCNFRYIIPDKERLDKKSYFAHSKLYLFDKKHLLIISSNFSENGLMDKNHNKKWCEYDFGVDIELASRKINNEIDTIINKKSFIIYRGNIDAINKVKHVGKKSVFLNELKENINEIYEKSSFTYNDKKLHEYLNSVTKNKNTITFGKNVSFKNEHDLYKCIGMLCSNKFATVSVEYKNGSAHNQEQYRIRIKNGNEKLFDSVVKWKITNENRINCDNFVKTLLHKHNFKILEKSNTNAKINGIKKNVIMSIPGKYHKDFNDGYKK